MVKVVSYDNEKKKVLLRDKVLVESSFNISATENKMLYCILQNAQVRRDDELHCSMYAKDFYGVVSKNEHKTPKYIKECLNRLMCVQYKFWNDEIEGNYNLIAGWIRRETDVFEISIPKEIYKRLMRQKVYSPLNLEIITSLKSFYSQRLYELFRLWSRNNKDVTQTFTVEYIRFIMGLEDGVCKEFKHLNQYIKLAIKDIERKTNMRVECNVIKQGRKAVRFEFKITDADERVFFKEMDNASEDVGEDTKFDGTEMTAQCKNFFKKEFSYCDMNDEHVRRAYEQACKETMKALSCKKIGKNQYGYFSQLFGNKIAWLEGDCWAYSGV